MLVNEVHFAKFSKIFPSQNFALYGKCFYTKGRHLEVGHVECKDIVILTVFTTDFLFHSIIVAASNCFYIKRCTLAINIQLIDIDV